MEKLTQFKSSSQLHLNAYIEFLIIVELVEYMYIYRKKHDPNYLSELHKEMNEL